MEKKTLNHHFMVIKSLLKIAIDLERRFCTNHGLKGKSGRQNGKRTDRTARSAKRGAEIHDMAAKTRPWPRFRGHVGAAAPVLLASCFQLGPPLLWCL